jgi:hypothetical protein
MVTHALRAPRYAQESAHIDARRPIADTSTDRCPVRSQYVTVTVVCGGSEAQSCCPPHPAASTVVSLFPADIAWAHRDFEPYGSLSNRFTGEFQVEAFA